MLGLELERLTTQSGETTYNASKWTSVTWLIAETTYGRSKSLKTTDDIGAKGPV